METCIVGCKLPHGLKIDLAGVPQAVTLKGANAARILGGFGLTPGVPKEAMLKWLADHETLAYVRNGSVYVVDSKRDAVAASKERRNELTGFEPIDPKKMPGGLSVEDAKVLDRQRAGNPDRNRQFDELDA